MTVIGLSTSKTGEDKPLEVLLLQKYWKNENHKFSTGQKVTDSDDTNYYLAKLDDDHFVLATSSSNAEAVSIQTATYDETDDKYFLEGNTFVNGDEITLFDSENGIGHSYQIKDTGDQFSLK